MKGHVSSTLWVRDRSLCNNCLSRFSECAEVHRPSGKFYVGLVRDQVVSAPRPIIKIDLCKQAERECGGLGDDMDSLKSDVLMRKTTLDLVASTVNR